MNTGFIVLIPTIIVLVVALITRKVLLSLFLGIISACLIATNFSLNGSVTLLATRMYEKIANCENLLLIFFLIFLGILIEILMHTGCIRLYGNVLIKRIKTARQTQFTSLVLSLLFFLDDILNALMIGPIMRPIMDYFKKPRAKLAYLINSIGSSLSVIIPASSWTGMILGQLTAQGIDKGGSIISVDPFYFYISMLPFFFFPIMSIIAVCYIVGRNISFGKMAQFETIAQETGNVFGGKEPLNSTNEICEKNTSFFDITLPLATFIIVFVVAIFASGDYWFFGGSRSLFDAFVNAKSALSLFLASGTSLLVASIRYLITSRWAWKKLCSLAWNGFWVMKTPLLLLLFAWVFSALLQHDIHTGEYITHHFLSSINITLLPAIVFFITTLISASIGSPWGTIMILMPLTVPVISHLLGQPPFGTESIAIFAPSIAAVIGGSIAGTQLSPISNASIISAFSAQCYHIDHVKTQITYALPVVTGSVIAYGLFGWISMHLPVYAASTVALATGLIITFVIFELCNRK